MFSFARWHKLTGSMIQRYAGEATRRKRPRRIRRRDRAPAVGKRNPSLFRMMMILRRARNWQIAWPERLSQHDVVYLSPPDDPSLGLPIGNGDLGALLWSTSNELVVALNKCDTWDDGPAGPFSGRRELEEHFTTLRHCGRRKRGQHPGDLRYSQKVRHSTGGHRRCP